MGHMNYPEGGNGIDCMGRLGQRTCEFENQEEMGRGNGVEG